MLVDLGLAVKLMPAYGMSAEEAWRTAASYYGSFVAKELYHLGLLSRADGGKVLAALGLDPQDATGGPGKKGWTQEPIKKRK